MGQRPAEISFQAWLDYVFGCPVGPSGFREAGDDWWEPGTSPGRAVEFLTRLFEAPEVLLERYPRDQIGQGLWFLASESGHLEELLGPQVAWNERARGLAAIGSLYSRLFARECTNSLGHRERGPARPDPIDTICYMWWDLFPTWGGRPGQEATDEVILGVLAETLRLESEACREGALHGLGHWCLHYPRRVAALVDEWLGTEPRISTELRQYARAARGGCVL